MEFNRQPIRRIEDDNDNSNGSATVPQNELFLTDILVKLPPKPLLRFKCVSKSWCSLISRTEFTYKHLHEAEKTLQHCRLLAISNPGYLRSLSISSVITKPTHPKYEIVDPPLSDQPLFDELILNFNMDVSCNGLVLVHSSLLDQCFIWNPKIRRVRRLPPIPDPDPDLSTLEAAIGFGYDEVNKEYKVVASITLSVTSEIILGRIYMLYTSRSNAWKEIVSLKRYDLLGGSRCKKQLNGALHWLSLITNDHNGICVLSFDLATEELQEIPTPCYQSPEVPEMKLWEYDGCLSIIMAEESSTKYYIWGMDKGYPSVISWSPLFKIPMLTATLLEPAPDLLWHSENGELLLLQYASCWILLNTKSCSVKAVRPCFGRRPNRKGVYYVESLVSPDAI